LPGFRLIALSEHNNVKAVRNVIKGVQRKFPLAKPDLSLL
jgi:hypothetical protein